MKSIILVISCFLLSGFFAVQAQIKFDSVVSNHIMYVDTQTFGGISAIEYNPKTKEVILGGDRGRYFVLKDSGTVKGVVSGNLFKKENLTDSSKNGIKTGMYYESIRFDVANEIYYYSVEDDSTAIYYSKGPLRNTKGSILSNIALPHRNKGIEALAITPSGALWVAPEAGWANEVKSNDNIIHFYRYKQPLSSSNESKPEKFKYKIKRFFGEAKFDNDQYGGIAEIIAIDEANLLVLERCFVKSPDREEAYLQHVRVNESKQELEILGDAYVFQKKDALCNVEGMCWGDKEKKTLVIIADDGTGDDFHTNKNDSPTLKNQIIILKRN